MKFIVRLLCRLAPAMSGCCCDRLTRLRLTLRCTVKDTATNFSPVGAGGEGSSFGFDAQRPALPSFRYCPQIKQYLRRRCITSCSAVAARVQFANRAALKIQSGCGFSCGWVVFGQQRSRFRWCSQCEGGPYFTGGTA